MKRVHHRRGKHSVDGLMLRVAASLIRDFRGNLDDISFCCNLESAINRQDITKCREVMAQGLGEGLTAYRFKAAYQIQSLFKRYRFRKDLYSDAELTSEAIWKFKATQHRLRDLDYSLLPDETVRVVQVARFMATHILGPYSEDEHRSLCQFGKRASVGVPSRMACEASRWELPISGSPEQISWFDSEMSRIDSVQDYWMSQLESDPNRSIYQETSSLKLTLVPKTFKSFRSIMPNTTIGSYISDGLGRIMMKRLKRYGYDIRVLQHRHRVLAQQASVHKQFVTADLSSASDSISSRLLALLLPKDWFDVLNRTRIGTVELPDASSVEMETFCTMGIGYTFPLQTLVFLVLLKAIEYVHFKGRVDRRTISVYGDDMIYHRRMHEFVTRYFSDLGFVINIDKTYHEGDFRESCGGDYYRGVDVRPFQPQNGSAHVSSRTYEAILYKYVNGLRRRWEDCEIKETLDLLLSEIGHVTGKAKLVPCDYPDDSGIKVTLPVPKQFGTSLCAQPKSIGHGVFRFSYLKLKTDMRKEERHVPFLWSRLRGSSYTHDFSVYNEPGRGTSWTQRYIEYRTGQGCPLPLLSWEKSRDKSGLTPPVAGMTGRRLRRLVPCLGISHTGRYVRQSWVSCFETRS